MKVFVIIADIINSKEIDNRKSFQNKMKSCLETINQNSYSIVSPYTITLGDEFQAVYKNSSNMIKDIISLLTDIYPIRVRFSISFDKITTDINKENSIGMDGPVFHSAREGLMVLKKIDYSIIQFYGAHLDDKELINKSLNLAMSIMSDWKKNTMVIFNELLHQKPVKNIVPLLDITERAIYKNINTQRLKNFMNFFTSIENKINKVKG